MFQRTELTWDKYIKYLEKAINKSKFNKRAEIKPMSTPKGAGESHLTSRANHERLASEIIRDIANELGLNADYAYIGMLMHDAGHPFSAHEGEEIFNLIGRTENCGFFHHNAKGVEVVFSEDICQKAINMIPGIEHNPELKEKLEEEFYYFLDIIVSHDGEATKKDMDKKADEYPSMKEAVLTKVRKSNSQNNYKFIAQTEEGKLAKVADVLAYVPTDIQDGFRLGIINGFSDKYLEIIGTMISKDKTLDEKGKIELAREFIDSIKEKKLRELEGDLNDPSNKIILGYAKDIIKRAKEKGLNTAALSDEEKSKIEELIDEKVEEIRANTAINNDEEEQMLYSDMIKLREFTSKLLSVSTDVVADITNRIEQYFIEDFKSNSKKTGELQFSEEADKLFYAIKKLNYKEIVQYTKWDYQRDGQPEAALGLVNDVAKSLVLSGAIRDKFYDRSVRKYITDPEALKYMVTPKRDEKEYEEYKIKTRIIRGPKTLNEKYTETNPKKLHAFALYKSANEYVRKHGKNFARKYMNVFEAIPYTVAENVECALTEKSKYKDFLKDYQKDNNNRLRARFISEYGSIEEAKKRKQEIIAKMVEEERKTIEEKVAKQMAIDYLSGMTDRSFNDLAIKTGYMTYEQVYEAKRPRQASESVKKYIEDEEAGLEL